MTENWYNDANHKPEKTSLSPFTNSIFKSCSSSRPDPADGGGAHCWRGRGCCNIEKFGFSKLNIKTFCGWIKSQSFRVFVHLAGVKRFSFSWYDIPTYNVRNKINSVKIKLKWNNPTLIQGVKAKI